MQPQRKKNALAIRIAVFAAVGCLVVLFALIYARKPPAKDDAYYMTLNESIEPNMTREQVQANAGRPDHIDAVIGGPLSGETYYYGPIQVRFGEDGRVRSIHANLFGDSVTRNADPTPLTSNVQTPTKPAHPDPSFISVGMTEDQVRDIEGPPKNADTGTTNGQPQYTFWYYDEFRVVFDYTTGRVQIIDNGWKGGD